MFIDELNQAAQKNGKGLSRSGRCIDKTAFSPDDVLPGLLLVGKLKLPDRATHANLV